MPSAAVHTSNDKSVSFELGTADPKTVSSLLALVEKERQNLGIRSYDTHGTSLEEVFLSLMEKESSENEKTQLASEPEKLTPGIDASPVGYGDTDTTKASPLSDGRKTSVFSQALVVCLKRFMIARRSFLPPILALACLLCASIIPLRYMVKRHETCAISANSDPDWATNLYLPTAGEYTVGGGNFADQTTFISPFDLTSYLGNITDFHVGSIPSGVTFSDFIASNYKNLSIGGLSLDPSSRQALITYQSQDGALSGPALLNLASNIMLNQIESSKGPKIVAQYSNFPGEAMRRVFSLSIPLHAHPFRSSSELPHRNCRRPQMDRILWSRCCKSTRLWKKTKYSDQRIIRLLSYLGCLPRLRRSVCRPRTRLDCQGNAAWKRFNSSRSPFGTPARGNASHPHWVDGCHCSIWIGEQSAIQGAWSFGGRTWKIQSESWKG